MLEQTTQKNGAMLDSLNQNKKVTDNNKIIDINWWLIKWMLENK